MEPKVNYTLVGLFIAVLAAAGLAAIVWLSKGEYGRAYERYYTFMKESVAGLSVNAAVKYRGVEVGRVKTIELNPENPEEVRLTLDLDPGTPVKEDTIAVLETQGLTGLATVNLTGGTRESPRLVAKAGEPYPVIQSGPSLFFRLDMALSKLLAEQPVTTLLANLSALSQDARDAMNPETRAALKQTLADLAAVTHALAERKDDLERGLTGAARTADNLATVNATMKREVPPLLERVSESTAALEAIADDLAKTSAAVRTLVKESKPGVEQFTRQTLPETGQLVAELRQLTASLQRVARQLEREPSSLVLGRPPMPRGPGE